MLVGKKQLAIGPLTRDQGFSLGPSYYSIAFLHIPGFSNNLYLDFFFFKQPTPLQFGGSRVPGQRESKCALLISRCLCIRIFLSPYKPLIQLTR